MSAELEWDAIYRLCAPSLRRFIRTRVPAALVEDTLQDTFVRAYRSRHRFDPSQPPLPWLLTIARRACSETVRVLPPEMPLASVAESASHLRDDPHQLFESRVRIEAMSQALSGLSPRHRRLLLAWEVEHDTAYPVLADEEGISTKALKSALCRARSAFRSRYAALAERAGVAALVPWSVRLRARVQRAWAWLVNGSPLAEATVGGFAAAVVSVAVAVAMLVPTSDASGAGQTLIASPSSDMTPTASPSPPPGAVVGRPAANDPPAVGTPTATESTGRPTSQPTAAVGAGDFGAHGNTDLGVDSNAAVGSITFGSGGSIGNLTYNEEIEIRCDGTLLHVVCATARQTPLAG